ncbi:MAG: M23 family metallopeptidase [Clostridia bacterium]|nr:M23 family metallopeptidase [Clostridia bacterium]
MDYEEGKHDREMSKTSFVMIIALCLLAVGAITYFALSGIKSGKTDKSENSDDGKAYSSRDDSYNSSVDEPEIDVPTPSESVDKNESTVPYEESEPQESEEVARTFILPVKGNISKNFSDTSLQYSATYGDMRMHTGIDILCNTKTDVKCAANGTVIAIEESPTLGRTVTVDHGGDITIKYCGFESINVKQGDSVNCGDVLGTSGTVPCEANDQPHIHIELYQDSVPASPLEVMGLN